MTKTSRWDLLNIFNKETGELFGVATVTSVTVKTLGTITEDDWVGHDCYESDEAMYTEFRSYYGDGVSPDTEVKIIHFDFKVMSK